MGVYLLYKPEWLDGLLWGDFRSFLSGPCKLKRRNIDYSQEYRRDCWCGNNSLTCRLCGGGTDVNRREFLSEDDRGFDFESWTCAG